MRETIFRHELMVVLCEYVYVCIHICIKLEFSAALSDAHSHMSPRAPVWWLLRSDRQASPFGSLKKSGSRQAAGRHTSVYVGVLSTRKGLLHGGGALLRKVSTRYSCSLAAVGSQTSVGHHGGAHVRVAMIALAHWPILHTGTGPAYKSDQPWCKYQATLETRATLLRKSTSSPRKIGFCVRNCPLFLFLPPRSLCSFLCLSFCRHGELGSMLQMWTSELVCYPCEFQV